MAIIRSLRQSRQGLLAILLLLGFGLRCIREDEFECEEAVAHLQVCCGMSLPSVMCTYQERMPDCGASARVPDLPIAQARCLRQASCDQIKELGACANPIDAVCK